MTGEHYRETATAPAYDLVLAVSRRHLRAPPAIPWGCAAPARRQDGGFALMALVSDSMEYPTGSLFSECQGFASPQLVAMASNRAMSRGAPNYISFQRYIKIPQPFQSNSKYETDNVKIANNQNSSYLIDLACAFLMTASNQ